MLRVKKLDPRAKLPEVAHEGDLGYDLFALEDGVLDAYGTNLIRTGIAAQAFKISTFRASDNSSVERVGYVSLGLLIRDRSSMAGRRITVSGGVIDAGYTGEIIVRLTNGSGLRYDIDAGDKIAQMIPLPVLTGKVVEVEELDKSSRGDAGFGSTGK
jgi:dUTP pyrophosphatase